MMDRRGALKGFCIIFLSFMLVTTAVAQQPAAREGYFETFDGKRMYWQGWRVENPAAVIVLVHGYGSSSELFDSFVEHLNENDISAYALDLRGQGKSDGERMSVDSFEDYVKDLELFMDIVKEHEGRDKVFLLGQSLGGDIVLRYAIEHPGDIEGLVAMGPGIGMQFSGHSIPLSIVRLFYPFLRLISRFIPDFSMPVPGINNRMNMKMMAESTGSMIYLWENVNSIDVPCLFVIGSEDQVVPLEALRRFYDAVPSEDKRFSIVEGADHFLFSERNVNKTAGVMGEWLFGRAAQLLEA